MAKGVGLRGVLKREPNCVFAPSERMCSFDIFTDPIVTHCRQPDVSRRKSVHFTPKHS